MRYVLGISLIFALYVHAEVSNKSSSDQNLESKIYERVDAGRYSKSFERVTVEANKGVVTLSGSVKTQADKENVEREVRRVSGVKSVNSQLTVELTNFQTNSGAKQRDFTQDTFKTNADEELNKRIRLEAGSNGLWNKFPDVALNSSNGYVTLEGSVENIDDREILLNEIQKVEGVKTVKSNLKIQKQAKRNIIKAEEKSY